MNVANVKSAAASALPQSVQTAAYEAGLSDAAASLAREKAGLDFVSSAGSKSGLVDNEYSRKMAKEQAGTAALLNTLGKNLGVRIEMVDTISGGKANGVYIAGKNLIRIAADANTAVDFVAAHEVTHRMQELAPEEYRAYRDHAVGYYGEEGAAEYVAEYMAKAEDAGVKLTQEEAMDEIAADFTEDMMKNGKLFENLAKENRPAAKRILDALKAFIAKVKSLFHSKAAQDRAAQDAYGKSMAELEQCAALWQKAYDAAGKQAQKAKTAAREGDGEGRFSLKRTSDGQNYVMVENAMTNAQLNDRQAIADYIAQHIGEVYTIIESGQKVYIGDDLPAEYTRSRYTQSIIKSKKGRVKNRAVSNLGEMIEIATNRRWEKTKHTHNKDAAYGMYRYDTTFAFSVQGTPQTYKAYDAEMVIRNASDGKKYLYDIVAIRENTGLALDLNQKADRRQKAATQSDVSTDSISTSGEKVNGKFSLKAYSDVEKKQHVKDAKAFFGRTYKWAETGYITTDGARLDFSGKHDGGPGGYRTVDHRDIRDALGDDYGGDDYSGAMVQFMGEGNIRISPESGGINLSVMPTKAQMDTLSDFISKERGEVVLDLDDTNGVTLSSTEYPRGTHSNKVLNDIKAFFETGATPQVSELGKFRYQLKGTDSAGRQLTEQQQEYFKDSKVRDAEGNLRPMYQGGTGSFTVFDRKKSKSSNLYGHGFYFTDSKTHAGQYGDVREFYLNITNPVSTTETTITRAQMRRFLAAVAENEDDFSFENYGYGATVDSVLRSLYGKSDFLMLNDVSQTAIGDMVAAVELFNEVNGTSYDGLIMDTETVAFRPEQIKNVDNKKPTGDPDIRFQLKSAKYWRPDLSATEWELLNRKMVAEINNRTNFIDDATKWVYANEKGVQVFALYGIGDGTDPTPLYAVGGKFARRDMRALTEYLEEVRNDGSGQDIDALLKGYGRSNRNGRRNISERSRGMAESGAAELHGGSPQGDAGGTDGRSTTDQPAVKDKSRFQLKSAVELEREVRELKKERRALENRNKVLTERVAKWRGELRRTETPSVRPGDVKKLGRRFLDDYGSSTDYRAIEGDMTALGKALMADDVSVDTLRPHARAAAEKIIDGVLVQAESGGELLAIRDHLKNVTLRYTDDGSIPDFKDWRRANRRTLKISDKSGLDVDVAYSELTEMFGEGYFPSTIVHPSDQLLRMSEVLDNVGRIYENPFDGYHDAAVTELSDLLIDGMIGEDVRQNNPTFADRKALELQETLHRTYRKGRWHSPAVFPITYPTKLSPASALAFQSYAGAWRVNYTLGAS